MNGLPFLAHGITLALAWFFLVNMAAAALVSSVAARLTKQARPAAADRVRGAGGCRAG